MQRRGQRDGLVLLGLTLNALLLLLQADEGVGGCAAPRALQTRQIAVTLTTTTCSDRDKATPEQPRSNVTCSLCSQSLHIQPSQPQHAVMTLRPRALSLHSSPRGGVGPTNGRRQAGVVVSATTRHPIRPPPKTGEASRAATTDGLTAAPAGRRAFQLPWGPDCPKQRNPRSAPILQMRGLGEGGLSCCAWLVSAATFMLDGHSRAWQPHRRLGLPET